MISCQIDHVVVACDDMEPPSTVEYFETHLARIAGAALTLWESTITDDVPEPFSSPDESDDDESDDDDPLDGEQLPEPIILFTPDETFDA